LTDHYVCNSQAMIDRGEAKRIFDPHKTTLIHSGIESALLDPALLGPLPPEPSARRGAALRAGTITVGFVGRLEEQKGAEFLLRAAAIVRLRNAAVRFVLAGDGQLRSRLEKLAGQLGVKPIVEFLGWQHDITPVLEEIDILAVPSLWESFGLSAAEAMAMQKPVVAAGVEGLLEVVVPGTTGLLVPPADPQALATAILELAADPARRRAFGIAGRERVERLFTVERMIASHERLYSQMMLAAPSSPSRDPAESFHLAHELLSGRFGGGTTYSKGADTAASSPERDPEPSGLESCHD
jgi:glycosyltransferase involved in cell wall biosynthesis